MTFEEKTLSSTRIYEGAILNLRKDEVTVRTGRSYREIIEHNGGAAIAALTDDNRIIMVKQYRKAAKKVMLEVPAGKRDGAESGEEVARRELREETGFTAERLIHLTDMFPTPGYSEEKLSIFLAEGLTAGETEFDDNEAIDILTYPLEEMVGMVMKGEIDDAKTMVAILMADRYVRERQTGGNENAAV